jgi:hypothetical protein
VPHPDSSGQHSVGYLQYPDDATAVYMAPAAGGSDSVLVTWSSAGGLDLSIVCPGGRDTVTGQSPLRVEATAGSGTCVVTVDVPATVAVPVSYAIAIEEPA